MANNKNEAIRKGRFIYQETVNELKPYGACNQADVRAVNLIIAEVKEQNVWGRLVLNSDLTDHPKTNAQHTVYFTGVVDEHGNLDLVTDDEAFRVNPNANGGFEDPFPRANIFLKHLSHKDWEVITTYDNGNSSISQASFRAKKSKSH